MYWRNQRDFDAAREVIDDVPDHLKNQPPAKFYIKDFVGNKLDGMRINPALVSPFYDEADELRHQREIQQERLQMSRAEQKQKEGRKTYVRFTTA